MSIAKAVSFYHAKRAYADDTIIEIRIWKLPRPNEERPHGYKYSLFFGRPGERLVGYDNERGKGDHKHIKGLQSPYEFVTIDKLLFDFRRDVALMRKRL